MPNGSDFSSAAELPILNRDGVNQIIGPTFLRLDISARVSSIRWLHGTSTEE